MSRADLELALLGNAICLLLFAVACLALTRHPQWFG
jgi:hypothetical protein